MNKREQLFLVIGFAIVLMSLPLLAKSETLRQAITANAKVEYREILRFTSDGKFSAESFYQTPYVVKKDGNSVTVEF